MINKIASGIILLNDEDEILVEHPTNHSPNFWSIPKGMVNKGEELFDAALRETMEETSLNIRKINHKVLTELPLIHYKSKRKSIKIFVIRSFDDLSNFELHCTSMVTHIRGVKLDHPFPEVDGYKWVTINEAYNLLHESQVKALDMIIDQDILSS